MAKSKIIKDLANGEVDTITALKRAKVLVSALNNTEISKWLDYEISGYPEDAAVPSYRKTYGSLRGSYFKGSMASHMTWTNVSLPLGKMPDETKEILLSVVFQEGVESLKKLAEKSQVAGTEISKSIPADFFPAIATYNNDPYMMITSARVVVGEHVISNIFSVIENKLLDMLMILEKEFGCLDELDIDTTVKSEEELKAINDRIFVLVYNDNRVSIGDGNKIKGTTIASEIK
ncbi:hypothetical protein [[Ruminococcus] torques]|uniref:AbiTii domain-containing protein n=1 Tax=[Ruminococcus] torques TaxID=33039 RepID=UPI0025A3E228|nr:hypothetical protein [[Ruminococcus] torques]MDM8237367.1 hypothetical protein [[Ruminococcus] torques]